MAPTARTLLNRLLSRLLSPGRGEVRALEEALHLEGVLRFVLLFATTVVVPALFLGWIGIRSIQGEEHGVEVEVRRTAELASKAFAENLDREFALFEEAVRTRLEAGRSSLESPTELHPDLVVALRFDRDLRLEAPFILDEQPSNRPGAPLSLLSWRSVDRRVRDGLPPEQAASLFGAIAASSERGEDRARARFDQARNLGRAGQKGEARALLTSLGAELGSTRDPWGFRYADLAELERAGLILDEDPQAGAEALVALVDRLLADRWTVGRGGEAAIARRALALAEPQLEPDQVAAARSRIARHSTGLYWAEELLPEFDRTAAWADAEGTTPGMLRWHSESRALWATTRWEDDLYAYGFDLDALKDRLKADARAATAFDSPVSTFLLGPEEEEPAELIERQSLAPYLSGWSVAVSPRDPAGLRADQRLRRALRFGVVALSVGMIALGFGVSLRFLGRELDVARMKTDFAASVSHELRSPITQIRLKGESLLLGLADTDEERDEAFHAIVRESERLSRLVDNVLDFAAIERGAKSYALRPGDLANSVHRALESMESSLEFKDMNMEVVLPDDLPAVDHDPDAVAQCVINLVGNAAKYSPEGETIAVIGRLSRGALHGKEQPFVEIDVIDQGIGIAAHDLRSIFEPFYRSKDSLARRRKGTGIGLTITRYIMEAHGGDILVRSKPGKGSTFTLRFPLEAPAADGQGAPPSPRPDRNRARHGV